MANLKQIEKEIEGLTQQREVLTNLTDITESIVAVAESVGTFGREFDDEIKKANQAIRDNKAAISAVKSSTSKNSQAITDLRGEIQRVKVIKGEKGDKGDMGAPGRDGITPRKGIDFFTESDKTELTERLYTDVLSQVRGEDTAFHMARALETLQDEDKIHVSAIRGLPDIEKRISQGISRVGRPVGGGMLSVFDSSGKVGSGTSIKFTGSGVNSVSHDGHQATIDISGGGGSVSFTQEEPSGTVNGSNVTFTITSTPTTDSEDLYVNGQKQRPGASYDYTISSTTITMNYAPPTGSTLWIKYTT